MDGLLCEGVADCWLLLALVSLPCSGASLVLLNAGSVPSAVGAVHTTLLLHPELLPWWLMSLESLFLAEACPLSLLPPEV